MEKFEDKRIVGYDVWVGSGTNQYKVCCLSCYDPESDKQIMGIYDERFWENATCWFCSHDLKCAISGKHRCPQCIQEQS